MRADTGVGPSIASGSQTCSGNWALLPIAPAKISRAMAATTTGSTSPISWSTTWMSRVPEGDEDEHDPEREADVADAVDDERLLGRERGGPLAIPEPDEQVARQADQLPGDEDDEEAAREDQQQHREHEQVQVGEEAPVARVVAHVADRVDVDQQADRRHHDEQARRQVVDEEADIDHEVAGRDPGEQRRGRSRARRTVRRRSARCSDTAIAMSQEAKTASTGIQWACLCSRRPMSAVIAKPGQRQDRDERDELVPGRLVERHRFIASYSSTSGVCLLR